MDNIFLKVLNMSISAGWLVLAILLLRLVLKKAPKWIMVAMWALVGIRLICPVSLESGLSLLPSGETVSPGILYATHPQIDSGVELVNQVINPVLSQSFSPQPMTSINPMQVVVLVGRILWVAGMICLLAYTVFSFLRIHRRVREAVPAEGGYRLCDHIDSPFIFGVFRPRIYIPSGMEPEDLPLVLAHERAHIQRRDHLWKPLGFLLLSIHWFNPLMWIAYVLLCRDIELACDEKVLEKLGSQIKKPYSNALLQCSVSRKWITACPLAFGEVGVKQRIKSVLSYRKPAFWIVLVAVVLCIALAVGFLTNPVSVSDDAVKVFLDCQIAQHHQSEESAGRACCVDWQMLGSSRSGKEKTVYLWVLYEEYTMQNGQLHQENGAHTPTAITYRIEDGQLKLVEYWTPRDGAYWASDIREKFPLYLYFKGVDSQRYFTQQQIKCQQLAKSYFEYQPTVQQTATTEALRKKYPEYFDLDTTKGLEVCVWQMAERSYSCALFPGRNRSYTFEDLAKVKGTTVEEMRQILTSYQLPSEDIAVVPVYLLYSSYFYEIDEDYQKRVENLIKGTDEYHGVYPDRLGLRMTVEFTAGQECDITFTQDSDFADMTGTITTTPAYELRAKSKDGAWISFGDYMRKEMHQQDYQEPSLEWTTFLYTRSEDGELTFRENLGEDYKYHIQPDSSLTFYVNFRHSYGELPPGTYLLIKDVTLTTEEGETLTKWYYAEFAILDETKTAE